ncbi:MAG: HAD hydrolase family protein [Thermomonas sp.]|uniref:KdsC family phosphatase n=1 Tax=Thermomonas sp. TaxID=1971895 RepID=UPI001ED7C4AB|nr:HAD hydrolase family protein [Thermomonas sp.]MBV2209906.1 HAD hydrolase family protein [Thermomonas sp.]
MSTLPFHSEELLARAAKIRLIGFDVDGTLTDGGLYFNDDGRESKRFHVQDGMGIVLLHHVGIATALISARPSAITEARGRQLKFTHLHVGERNKLACLQAIAQNSGLSMDEVAFIGDDLPDLATLRAVGLAIAPANAHPWVTQAVHWVTPHAGGDGAARDACDLLLHAQHHVGAILAHGEHP